MYETIVSRVSYKFIREQRCFYILKLDLKVFHSYIGTLFKLKLSCILSRSEFRKKKTITMFNIHF